MTETKKTEERPISLRRIHAFRRYYKLLPRSEDRTLLILKAHLLIEEQVRQIIDERLKYPTALSSADLGCYQAICLAEAFFEPELRSWLWSSLKKLNSLRNTLAHKLEPIGVDDRIEDIITTCPSGFSEMPGKSDRLHMTLVSMFMEVAELVETPAARVLQFVPHKPT